MLTAQNNAETYRIRAKKAIGPIQLDGTLDEPSWQTNN